jgi:AraC family transcriptional activator of mtrCDE
VGAGTGGKALVNSRIGEKEAPGQVARAISKPDLNRLMNALEIDFVRLSECVVSPGWRLLLGGPDTPGIHYNLSGEGHLVIGDTQPIKLRPHTLVVVPPGSDFYFETPGTVPGLAAPKVADGRNRPIQPGGGVRRFSAGEGEPRLIMICGYFRATYGGSVELFGELASPIVEQFDAGDGLDVKLKSALAELVAEEVGMGAMTAALMTQVMVLLLRRSLVSIDLWTQRFHLLGDPQIARAFSAMVANPGAAHDVEALAHIAGLSRSIFMVRFRAVLGKPPMEVLRDLRMKQAAVHVLNDKLSIDNVADQVGYASRTSFLRAFQRVHGCGVAEYRAARPQGASAIDSK